LGEREGKEEGEGEARGFTQARRPRLEVFSDLGTGHRGAAEHRCLE